MQKKKRTWNPNPSKRQQPTDDRVLKNLAFKAPSFKYRRNLLKMGGIDNMPFDFGCCWMCLPEDSLIQLTNRVGRISEPLVGESTLGYSNFTKILNQVSKPYNGYLISIKPFGSLPFRLTPEHKVLVANRKIKENWSEGKYISRDWIFSPVYWKEAKDLTYSDYLVFSKFKSSTLTNQINEDLAYLFGLYLADGFVYIDKEKRENLTFSLAPKDTQVANKLEEIINTKLERTATLDQNIRVRFCKKGLGKFILESFGKGAKNKRIPEWIYYQNAEVIKAFSTGYFAGDGYFREGSGSLHATTISVNLALQLQSLLSKVGVFMSVSGPYSSTDNIEGRKVNVNPHYRLRIDNFFASRLGYPRKKRSRTLIGEDDSNFYVPIKEIKTEKYVGRVWDITTSDSVFKVSNLIVHNCWIRITGEGLNNWRQEPFSESKAHPEVCPLCEQEHWKGRVWYPKRYITFMEIGNPSRRDSGIGQKR